MATTAGMVKELRERTGLGIMDCKRALEATDGDLEAAIDKLRKDGAIKAAKKAGRTTAEGLLAVQSTDDGRRAVLVEANIETDFAARNEKFVAWVGRVASAALQQQDPDVTTLLSNHSDLQAQREALVQEIGENIVLRRLAVLEGDQVGSYVHTDGRKGALIALTGKASKEHGDMARDLAMHLVAMAPKFVAEDQVDAADLQREESVQRARLEGENKPQEMHDKILGGRMRQYFAEVCLLSQKFIREDKITVGKLLQDAGLACTGFMRYEVGEGIEKNNPDFASEVAATARSAGS